MKKEIMIELVILGVGCSKCRELEYKIKDVIRTLPSQSTINLKIVDDIEVLLNHDIIETPALLINGEMIRECQEFSSRDIRVLLHDAIKKMPEPTKTTLKTIEYT